MPIEELSQTIPLDLDVSAYADEAHSSDSSALLGEADLQQVVLAMQQSYNSHLQSGHETSVDDVGTYSEVDIRTRLSGLLGAESIPMTRFGTMSYLPPAISTGIRSVADGPVASCAVSLEPDGTNVAIVPATDGRDVGHYYHYFKGLFNTAETVTNLEFRTYAPYTFKGFGGSTNLVTLSGAVDDDTQEVVLLVHVNNGSLKYGTYTQHKVLVNGYLANLLETTAIETLLTYCTVQLVGHGADQTVMLLVEDRVQSSAPRPFYIYTGQVPSDTRAPITMTERVWSVVRNDGGTAVQTGIQLFDSLAAPVGASSVPLVWVEPTAYVGSSDSRSGTLIIQDPEHSSRCLIVKLHVYRVYNDLGTLATYRGIPVVAHVDLDASTLVSMYINQQPVWSSTASSLVCSNPNLNHSRFENLASRNSNQSYFIKDNVLSVATIAFGAIGYSSLLFIDPQQRDLFTYFKERAYSEPIVPAHHKGFAFAPDVPITNRVRSLIPISTDYAMVNSQGFNHLGQEMSYSSSMPSIVRHNLGSYPLTLSVHGTDYPAAEPLSPRDRNTEGVNMRVLGSYISVATSGGLVAACAGQLPIDDPSMPLPLYLTAPNAIKTYSQETLTFNATAYAGLQNAIAQDVRTFYDQLDVYSFEVICLHVVNMKIGSNVPSLAKLSYTTANGHYITVIYQFRPILDVGSSVDVIGHSDLVHITTTTNSTSNIRNNPWYEPGLSCGIGHTVIYRYDNGGDPVHVIALCSKELTSNANSTFTHRSILTCASSGSWSFKLNRTSYAISHNPLFSVDPNLGLLVTNGDSTYLSQSGTRVFATPLYADLSAALSNTVNSEGSVVLFSVLPPATFSITLAEDIPVLLNGENRVLVKQTVNIHEVCESDVLQNGTYFIYLVSNVDGSLALATNSALIDDSQTRLLIGDVTFTTAGVSAFNLVKVTKIGKHRLTESAYEGREEEAIVYSSGHPSQTATEITHNLIP